MSEHSAEAVGQLLKARVAAIRLTTTGCETDIGAQVFVGRHRIDESMIPCTTIIEADDAPDSDRVGTEYKIGQRFIVYSYLACDPDNPNTAAHAALRDLKRAFFRRPGVTPPQRDINLGGGVKRLIYQGKEIGPRADGTAFVVVALDLLASYVEDIANP
jgi:hypothetical protein